MLDLQTLGAKNYQIGTAVADGAEQVEIVVYGPLPLGGPSPATRSAFTSTGITCPVPRLKLRCPKTEYC